MEFRVVISPPRAQMYNSSFTPRIVQQQEKYAAKSATSAPLLRIQLSLPPPFYLLSSLALLPYQLMVILILCTISLRCVSPRIIPWEFVDLVQCIRAMTSLDLTTTTEGMEFDSVLLQSNFLISPSFSGSALSHTFILTFSTHPDFHAFCCGSLG